MYIYVKSSTAPPPKLAIEVIFRYNTGSVVASVNPIEH